MNYTIIVHDTLCKDVTTVAGFKAKGDALLCMGALTSARGESKMHLTYAIINY